VDVITSTALDVKENTIAYGSIQAGTNSGATTSTTTVTNIGNGPLNSDINGEHMVKGGDQIRADMQRLDLASVTYLSLTYELPVWAASSSLNLDIDAPRPMSQASTTDYVYWGIGIPNGTPSGDYYGQNNFIADLDETGWPGTAQ